MGLAHGLGALTRDVTTMLVIPALLVLFPVVRGAPVFLYRNDFPRSEQLPVGLFASVASLGQVVVITEVGFRAGDMSADIAQALMGAALPSLLVYPTPARALLSKTARSAPPVD